LALVERAAHLLARDDEAPSVQPLLEHAPRFADLIEGEANEAGHAALRGAEAIDRPQAHPISSLRSPISSTAPSRRAGADERRAARRRG
jgi:hypothetical protein